MAKKPVALDGLLNTESRPTDTGIPQRGAGQGAAPADKKSAKRPGEKRLTLALDGETYKRLRLHAAETDQTHQAILEVALAEYLKRANA
ncbi:ribbon-helix-helix protein, CopG family [Paracoccus sediminicola]|uniref:ribbon-helix-helix protein, CopG family n=1 Tax=Paracoccus sediminicola TaxID=3017783 RepID=UPI0022EFE547|nr:ribbon-helix-helix protein, CopG family [Paracoccus sediminicola]WBU58730.1 ribbon-helix-helix protein, CopG family [Paracoccus sediminicola]